MSRRDQVALGVVLAGIGLAALCLGGAPRWAAVAAAALGVIAAVPYLRSRREVGAPAPLLLFFVAAGGLTALQLVPLPAALVGVLSPEKLAAVSANAAALGEAAPGWLALSMDPPRTAVELAKLCGYLGLAVAVLRLARGGGRMLAMGVAGVGALLAVIAMAHTVTGTDLVFGFYEPRTAEHLPIVSPLINPNHLAGLMALCAPVALALAVARAGRARVLWIAALAACAAVGLLTGSRGGVVALGAGTLACAGLLYLGRRKGRRHRARRGENAAPVSARFGAAITIACALVLGLALTGEMAWDQLTATRKAELLAEEGKLAVWKEATGLVADYPWVGVGRGGFEAAFAAKMAHGDQVFSHVENEPLQAVLDWGIPGTLVLAALFCAAVAMIARRWRGDPVDAGLAAGLAALGAHNLVDFSLEMPGVAMPAVVAAAVLSRATLVRIPRERRGQVMTRRVALFAAGAAALIGATTPWARSARADNERLAASTPRDPRVALAAARAILERHPADHVAAGRVAEALFALRDPRAVAMINRALALNPSHPGLHLVAARMLLASQDPDQALVQYRLAIAHTDYREARPLVAEVLGRFSDPALVARGFPTEGLWLRIIDGRLRGAGRTQAAVAYLRGAVTLEPARAEAWTRLSGLLRREGDVEGAIRAGRQAVSAGGGPKAALALSAAFRKAKNPAAAADTARRALEGQVTGRDQIRLTLALAAAQADAGQLRAAYHTLLAARDLCGTDRRMAEITARRIERIKAALREANLPAP